MEEHLQLLPNKLHKHLLWLFRRVPCRRCKYRCSMTGKVDYHSGHQQESGLGRGLVQDLALGLGKDLVLG